MASDGQPQGGGRGRRLFSPNAELPDLGGRKRGDQNKTQKGSAAMGNQEARVPGLGPVQGALGGGAAVRPGEAGGDRGGAG